MDATPIKPAKQTCCLCFETNTVVLVKLERCIQQDEEIMYMILKFIDEKQVDIFKEKYVKILSICRKCRLKLDNFSSFQKSAQKNLNTFMTTKLRFKRGHKPSLSNVPDAEFLSTSVEKLKITCDQPSSSSDKNLTSSESFKSKKRLHFTEDEDFLDEALDEPVIVDEIEEKTVFHAFPDMHNYAKTIAELSSKTGDITVGVDSETCVDKVKTIIDQPSILCDNDEEVNTEHFTELISMLKSNSVNVNKLAFIIMKHKQLGVSIKQLILKDVESRLQTEFKKQNSQLFFSGVEQILDDNFLASIFLEMKEKTGFLFDILNVGCHEKGSRKLVMMTTVFSMLMQSRNKAMSSVQRWYTTLCIRYHADNKLIDKLNAIHLTLSSNSKTSLITEFGDYSENKIINMISKGQDGKLNGDNLDIRVVAGDQRISSRDKDMHFFASDWTPYRVVASSLPNDGTVGDSSNITIDTFVLTENEEKKWKEDLKIIIDEDYEKLDIPIGGDQLTRVRLQGAKLLRAGSHTPQERFDHLKPIIIEMFHTLQDFLEKMCVKFLKIGKARDRGTLAHLKLVIQRSNVNGKVKTRFKEHEDFVLTVGKAYLHDLIKTHFGMDNDESPPTQNQPPGNVELFRKERRLEAFNTVMDNFLEKFLIVFSLEQSSSASKCTKDCDDLHNYVLNYLQWYFALIYFKDAIKEGDMDRVNISMKILIPFFYTHSNLSKYLTECIDYILKTEILLSPQLSRRVRAASFINRKGLRGKNKPADLEKENQVKFLKDLIRGLGRWKTEETITKISKAGQIILDIADSFDQACAFKDIKTTHKKKDSTEDLEAICTELKELNILSMQKGRILDAFKGITANPFETIDREKFTSCVMKTVHRLSRNIQVEDELEKFD